MNRLDVWDAYWWDAWFELSKGGAMRLKQHREDVKDLKLMNDAHVQDIARRYMRLILAYEDYLKDMDKYGNPYGKYDNRVIKEGENE